MEEEIKGSGDEDSTERARSRSDVTAVLHEDSAPIVLRSVGALLAPLTLLLLTFNLISHFTKPEQQPDCATLTPCGRQHTLHHSAALPAKVVSVFYHIILQENRKYSCSYKVLLKTQNERK